MKKFLFALLAGWICLAAAAREPLSNPADAIREAMARYEYSSAISLIDSALVHVDTADAAGMRTLLLMKARCLKKLYRFGDACRTLEPLAVDDDVEVIGELADSYANDGKTEDALGVYYYLMMKHPENVFFRLQNLSLLNRKSDWGQCIFEGKIALQIDSLPQIMSIVGHAYSKVGQMDSALVYYDDALRLRPDNVGYLTSVCNLLLAGEKYGEVIARTGSYLNNITMNEPQVESIYGFASYQMRNYGEAYKAFRKLKEEGDRSYTTFYYGGLSSLALENLAEAVENFKTAWQIDSTDAMLAAHYGDALRQCFRYEQADEMFDKALKLMEPDPAVEFKVYYGKGYGLVARENFKDAIPYYKRVYELNPSFISALSSIGYCYERLRDFTTAKKYYEQYLKLGKPDTRNYRFVEESLAYVNGELFMEE